MKLVKEYEGKGKEGVMIKKNDIIDIKDQLGVYNYRSYNCDFGFSYFEFEVMVKYLLEVFVFRWRF